MGRVQAPMTMTAANPWLTCLSRALVRTGSLPHLWRASCQQPPKRAFASSCVYIRPWRSGRFDTSLFKHQHPVPNAQLSGLPLFPHGSATIRFHSSSHATLAAKNTTPTSAANQLLPSPVKNHRSRTRRRPVTARRIQASAISHARLGRKFRLFQKLKYQARSDQNGGIKWDPRRGQLMNRETRILLSQFEMSLQRRDIRHAYDQYLFLRQQYKGSLHLDKTHFLTSRIWMDLQLNFLRLLYLHEHRSTQRAMSLTAPLRFFRWTSSSTAPQGLQLPGRTKKAIVEIQRRQNRLYEDMLVSTFHDYPGTAALARSLARSLSVLGHTDEKGGAIKKDWREALRPLEEWSKLYQGLDHISDDQASREATLATNATTRLHPHMAKRLTQHLELLMRKLVYTHTALISQLFDNVEARFGIAPTFNMHMTMLRYFAHFGYREGSTEALRIVKSMNDQQLPWQEEAEVYDLLLSSMSRRAGWRNEIRLLVDTMLSNGILPKEETMHAAMLCAARSGDVMTCSRYLDRMHREWGLSPSERLKSILLYACAKRGDFQGAVEVFGQLFDRGHLAWTGSRSSKSKDEAGKGDPVTQPSALPFKEAPTAQGDLDNALVNQTNLLLALINQSTAASKVRRQDHRQDRALIQEEVRSILGLFAMITRTGSDNSSRVDSHLYTILMKYLSTLPSPLQGMKHLYEEMLKKAETKPNLVTYKILLDACAEQMDMKSGQAYWNDMLQQGLVPNKHVRASFVKGWCTVGEFGRAEAACREALQFSLGSSEEAVRKARAMLRRQAQVQIQNQSGLAGGGNPRALRAIQKRLMNERMISRQLARQQAEAFGISVVDALMQGYVRHDMWRQACRVYESIEQGYWGNVVRPTPKVLSTYFFCCSQGGFVQQAIDTFSRIEGNVDTRAGKTGLSAFTNHTADQEARSKVSADGPMPGTEWTTLLTDNVFFHYFAVLGRSHRADLLLPTWKTLLQVGVQPSQRTVARMLDYLEDHQWGLSVIKQVLQDVESNWPEQDWNRVMGDRSGGRLWK